MGRRSPPLQAGRSTCVRPRRHACHSTDDFKNFRPVSNLPFISKLIEKVVAAQLVNYINDNNLGESF